MANPEPRSFNALRSLLRRTAAVMDEETDLLTQNPNANVSELAVRKNRCLFELSMAMEDLVPGQYEKALLVDLKLLKSATDRNERALSVQMNAAKDVITILGRFAQTNTFDGTYPVMRG